MSSSGGEVFPKGFTGFRWMTGKLVRDPIHPLLELMLTILGCKVAYGSNNTYKALRLIGKNYNIYYSVWCTNEHELYDLTVLSTSLDHQSHLLTDESTDRSLSIAQYSSIRSALYLSYAHTSYPWPPPLQGPPTPRCSPHGNQILQRTHMHRSLVRHPPRGRCEDISRSVRSEVRCVLFGLCEGESEV